MTDKYELIAAEKDSYPVRNMCRWLTVSASGFYDWHRRPPSVHTRRRTTLATQVRALFTASRPPILRIKISLPPMERTDIAVSSGPAKSK
ncbi:hypothetical protein FAGKG844_60146 [Frankia sp. AgKG'84/4]